MFASLILAGSLLWMQQADSPSPAEQPTESPATVETSAAPAASEELKTAIKLLVRDLDAAELAAREEAEQKLVALGPAALDLLPAPTNRMSAEVKERLGRVRDKLQRLEAEAVVEPTLITFSGQDVPLSKVLEAIAEQTGNRVVDYREEYGQEPRDPDVTVSLDKATFWEAMDTVLDAADSTLYPYAEETQGGLAVIDRPEGEGPRRERVMGYAGPFRVEGVRVDASADLRNAGGRTLILETAVAWEPRLRPINLLHLLEDVVATDEQGNAVEVDGEGALDVQVLAGEQTVTLQIPFTLPPRSVAKIASLKGSFTALIPGRMETFEFESFNRANQEQRKAGVAVILENVRRNNQVWEVRVRVRFDDAEGSLQSHLSWIFNNECYMLDAAGERVDPDTFETTRQTENEVGMAYYYGIEGKLNGYKLIYKTPAVIIPLEMEYEVKDIPLP